MRRRIDKEDSVNGMEEQWIGQLIHHYSTSCTDLSSDDNSSPYFDSLLGLSLCPMLNDSPVWKLIFSKLHDNHNHDATLFHSLLKSYSTTVRPTLVRILEDDETTKDNPDGIALALLSYEYTIRKLRSKMKQIHATNGNNDTTTDTNDDDLVANDHIFHNNDWCQVVLDICHDIFQLTTKLTTTKKKRKKVIIIINWILPTLLELLRHCVDIIHPPTKCQNHHHNSTTPTTTSLLFQQTLTWIYLTALAFTPQSHQQQQQQQHSTTTLHLSLSHYCISECPLPLPSFHNKDDDDIQFQLNTTTTTNYMPWINVIQGVSIRSAHALLQDHLYPLLSILFPPKEPLVQNNHHLHKHILQRLDMTRVVVLPLLRQHFFGRVLPSTTTYTSPTTQIITKNDTDNNKKAIDHDNKEPAFVQMPARVICALHVIPHISFPFDSWDIILPIFYSLIDSNVHHNQSMDITLKYKYRIWTSQIWYDLLKYKSTSTTFVPHIPTSHDILKYTFQTSLDKDPASYDDDDDNFMEEETSRNNDDCNTYNQRHNNNDVDIFCFYLTRLWSFVLMQQDASHNNQQCLQMKREALKLMFTKVQKYHHYHDNRMISCILAGGIQPLLNHFIYIPNGDWKEKIRIPNLDTIGRLGLQTMLPLVLMEHHQNDISEFTLGLTCTCFISLLLSAYTIMEHHGGKIMTHFLSTLFQRHAQQLREENKVVADPKKNMIRRLLIHTSSIGLVICGTRADQLLESLLHPDPKKVDDNTTVHSSFHPIIHEIQSSADELRLQEQQKTHFKTLLNQKKKQYHPDKNLEQS